MCGIISYFSNKSESDKKLQALVYNMLWIDSIRGDQSTGLIYGQHDTAQVYKKAMPGYDFIQLAKTESILVNLHTLPYLIGHNRAATRGDVNVNNAHPFQFGDITGVHNGTLYNGSELTPKDVYHPVDSQHLYDAISRDGVNEVLPKVNGSFNLLWHDNRDNTIHLCRNDTRPYTFAKLKNIDILIGASEKAMLKWLITRHGLEVQYCWSPKDNIEYIWEVEEDMVKPARKVKHSAFVPSPKKKQCDNPDVTSVIKSSGKTYNPTGTTSRISLVEFFIDSTAWDQHLTNGTRTFTGFGETVAGENIVIYKVPDGGLEKEVWYTGRGVWINNRKGGEDYYKMFLESIKTHPLENPEETLSICVQCGVDHFESNGVLVNKDPICLKCCRQLCIQFNQVDGDEGWKLQQH